MSRCPVAGVRRGIIRSVGWDFYLFTFHFTCGSHHREVGGIESLHAAAAEEYSCLPGTFIRRISGKAMPEIKSRR